jgi:hypothetical protein
MFRTLTILSVAFTLIFGSLGLPVYVHACQMSMNQTAAMDASCPVCNPTPSCPSCSEKQQIAAKHADNHGMSIKAKPCCIEQEIVQRTDASVLAKTTTLPLPLPVAFVTAILLWDSTQELKPHTSISHDRSPPLAARARMAYLLNSTFLI